MVLRRATAYSSGLVALLVAVVLTSATVGQADVGYRAVALAVLNGLPVPLVTAEGVAWTRPFAFPVSDTTAVIVRRVRLPRIALGAIVGFALALAGAAAPPTSDTAISNERRTVRCVSSIKLTQKRIQ